MRLLILLTFLLALGGCGKTSEEEIQGAVDIALTHLSHKRCDEALEALGKVSGQGNGIYVQVLASAHACKADFNEVKFIVDDLASITSTDASDLLRSLSILSTSTETQLESLAARSLIMAAQVALTGRSQNEREDTYGLKKAGDLGVQALLLNIANLGKFLHFYGNVDGSGVKGGGPQGSSCFLNYHDARAQAIIGAQTGACTNATSGHSALGVSSSEGRRRVCEGLMSLTNSIDILENLDLSNYEEFDVFVDVLAQLDTFKQAAHSQGLGYLIEELSQTHCESVLQSNSSQLDMEYLYALIFEVSLK